MKPRTPWFPSLGAEAPLAAVQVRQTLALGLVPLGIALLLMAAGAPERLPPVLWMGVGLILGGMGLLLGLFQKSGARHLRGYSTTHFLVRYLFIVLSPLLLWIVFGQTILEMAGEGPPLLLGLMVLAYPVGRILREKTGTTPAPRFARTYIVFRQMEISMFVLAVAGMVTGAIRDASRDYPTDPSPVLILVWVLALLGVLACVVLGVAQGSALSGPPRPPQGLDDAPSAPPPRDPLRFGSEKF